jgi:hypothetical protein
MEQIYGLVILIGPAILGWQTYGWLRTGVWTALPISKTFTYFEWPVPSTSWLGLQKMLDWVFDIPTSLAAFLISLLVLVLCAMAQVLIENYLDSRNAASRG